MAVETTYRLVSTLELKPCGVVIKISYVGYIRKRTLVMTLFALSRQLIIMRVVVTSFAIVKGHVFELLKLLSVSRCYFMTFHTIHVHV